ncbi:MAG TPA: ABC transporter permease subunit [Gemmataceae bacterium]|nr:ABC transporter permease subunit [Gemmataceae bacterium]
MNLIILCCLLCLIQVIAAVPWLAIVTGRWKDPPPDYWRWGLGVGLGVGLGAALWPILGLAGALIVGLLPVLLIGPFRQFNDWRWGLTGVLGCGLLLALTFLISGGLDWFKLTDRSLDSLRDARVPPAVLAKLNPLKDKEFETRESFLSELAKILNRDELARFQDRVLNQASLFSAWWQSLPYGLGYLGGGLALGILGVLALGLRPTPIGWLWGLGGAVGGGVGLAMLLESGSDAGALVLPGRAFAALLQLQLSADLFVLFYALLFKVWPKVGAVALAAFRESLRQPMFWLLFVIALVLMLVVPFLPYFTLGEDLKMVKELGYDLIMLFTVVFVVIAAATSISEEIEGRTAVTLMSKPISRRQFLLGKFVGLFTSGLVLVVLLGWFMVWMFLLKVWFDPALPNPQDKTEEPALVKAAGEYAPTRESAGFLRGMALWADDIRPGEIRIGSYEALPGLIILSGQVMILLALAVALATRLPMMVNIPVCLIFYFLGHLAPVLVQVSQDRFPLVKFMAQVFDLVLPGLEHFNLGPTIVRDAPLPRAEFALYTANVSLYAIMYTAIALLFGLILFEDRDLA